MYILNKQLFNEALKKSKFKTIENLATELKIHRNTIHHYLMGASVIPKNLDKILRTLKIDLKSVIIKNSQQNDLLFYDLVAKLQEKFPKLTFLLFGSRARGENHNYSDYDLGVYTTNKFEHKDFLKLLEMKDLLSEDLPFFIDLIDLTIADKKFLKVISNDWKLLSGNIKHMLELERKVNG